MVTLKEEIEEIAYTHLLTYSEDIMIDDILKAIEKQIDKEIKRYNDKMKSYAGQLDHSVDYYNCAERIEGLEELKEILT